MNINSKSIILLVTILNIQVSFCQSQIPHLQKTGNTTRLIIDSKPFIVLGGELGNSSASTIQYMQPIWPKLKAMNLNTVLVPVYWELIEKEEGKFDFTLIKQLITEARTNNLKIVFLWFASWKNSMSCYVPAWIKQNQDKFPRVKDDKNRSHEILTPFSENNLQADLKAFEKLMSFIKDFDESDRTVIMIQVENEIAMLPTARDYHPLANEAFQGDVPRELINYMQQNKGKLVPEFLDKWEKNGYKTSGNWEKIFGKGVHTDEIFMAWYYSKYTNRIIEAGKNIYPLPMFVNAALNRPNREPGKGYPSAGPLPHLMDVWKAAGPSIDFLAPDIYFPALKHWCDLYTRQGDPLFIPEHRFDHTAAFKSLYVIGHYDALGFAPFSIESTDTPENEPLGKMYHLLAQLMPVITSNQIQGKTEGVLLDKKNQDTIIHMGKYEFTFRHDYTLGWSPGAKEDVWPMAATIIIQTGEDEFYIAGSGVVIGFKTLNNDSLNTGILKDEEGMFENSEWKILRYLSGDQTHQGRHLRIPAGEYMIQRFELYFYK
jgi:regulator of sigma D